MRIWLLALASCWTGPVAPAPVAPAAVHAIARMPLKPNGYFVPNLIAHRLETRAFDEVDVLGGTFAVYPIGPHPLTPRFERESLVGRAFNSAPFDDSRFVVEYCIDATGRIASAHVAVQGEVQPGLRLGMPSDQNVLERLRGWRFAPYFVDGKPVMACSFIDYSTIAP
jgi:hypothetical protein